MSIPTTALCMITGQIDQDLIADFEVEVLETFIVLHSDEPDDLNKFLRRLMARIDTDNVGFQPWAIKIGTFKDVAPDLEFMVA